MEPVSENIRLLNRAYWLIKLRWIAIVFVASATYISSKYIKIELQDTALYGIAVILALYNMVVLVLLNYFAKKGNEVSKKAVKKIINVQISADLLILTILLHFSGGVENPFVFYFVFHMIIASILLSLWDSYLQATFAVLVFGLLVLLEYLQLIPHYCLRGFTPSCLHRNKLYILGTFFVFATALYLAVYMASYISVRLRRTERAYMQANFLLQEKDHIKNEYVLRVTHDIKSDLATIQSCLGMVVNKVVEPEDSQRLDFIDRAYTRTTELTNFVKTLLKLTQMRLNDKLETEMFSLKDTVQNAVAAVSTKAKEKSITLNCTVETSLENICGNQFSVEEVFTNLLLNAIRYTPEEGTVSINTKS
jgi:signal transduction histidine kinase